MPGLDITPRVAEGRQLIQSYGGGGFKVAGEDYRGSVLVFPESTIHWSVTESAAIDLIVLQPALERSEALEIIIVGCGPTFKMPPKGLKTAVKEAGLMLEWMDTGAACRTHSVLITEGRRAAAALIAIE